MNGYISTKIKRGGGRDSVTGAPIPVSYSWGEKIECKYSANELSNNGRYDGGTFKQASYTITTENMEFSSTSVKLFDSRKNEVCEKEVLSLERMEFIQRVKIVI